MGTSPAIEGAGGDDLLSEPAAGTNAAATKPPETTDEEKTEAEKKALADRQAEAERATAEFVAEATTVLQLSESQAELVVEELANPRLRVLPAAEQAGALTMIGELARLRELKNNAQLRLAEAGEENHDIAGLVEDARIKAAEYAEAVEEGGKEIERINRVIAEARERKAEAERQRIDAEVRLERRAHVVEAIIGELAQYTAGETDRQARLKTLLGEKKKS